VSARLKLRARIRSRKSTRGAAAVSRSFTPRNNDAATRSDQHFTASR